MLSLHDAAQRVSSKIACVNASREILYREIELRTFNPVSACCRMSDFMALIAGMALMLAHVTSHGGNVGDHSLVHQRLGDRATVTRVLDCIHLMSELDGDVLVDRCVTLLRALLAIEEDAAHQHGLLAHLRVSVETQHCVLITRESYLGSICISREGVSFLSDADFDQTRQVADDVIVGGIGSMLLRRRDSAEVQQVSHARNFTSPPVTPTSTDSDTNHRRGHNVESQEAATQNRSVPRYNVAPPFPAADFDGWGF
jgi:hypothetical protein